MKALLSIFFAASSVLMAADERVPERIDHPGNYLEQAGSIGATVMPMRGILRVTHILPGSPAEKASMKPDDWIIEIDGKKLAGLDAKDRVGLLRGKAGTKVTLLLERGEPAQEVRLSIERAPLVKWLTPKPQ